ncbi:thymidine phosphorylase [Gordonia sp. TBRC 11910]|uniref:Thymidine phosphorylase n=1 Tax=Gordonia asplenii TaxID=2725283 RepID=A0A848KX64_9ACTN|nr:thymidine phosphorylase [Gordonia asplenii]NMO01043.1 thymidine phosphorylase [Gordonia asplenii]
MSALDAVSIIVAKRDGAELSDAQIDHIVAGYTSGAVAEEQMSALLMAIVWRGMSRREIVRWTDAMIATGTRLDFTGLRRGDAALRTVDKHSTGGVGDKITLPLGPLVASYGVAVPQLSGRGLGHTGGTLDKLEAISGWRADLTVAQMTRQLADVGAVVCAAGADLAPADRKIYALRDVTGTVESIPLLASSIMSKKIAEGTAALVLDVKTGSGAFLKTFDESAELARTMVELGTDAGVATTALITDMNTPLGRTAGNALEVAETLEVLDGGGPADVVDLTLTLAHEMLCLAGLPDVDPASNLRNGRAMDSWRSMVAAQGGDPAAPLPTARHTDVVVAESTGILTGLDAMAVGRAAWLLGAGRTTPGAPVQAEAGVIWHAGLGESVRAGRPLFTLHTQTPDRFDSARVALADAVEVGEPRQVTAAGTVLARVDST